MDVGVYSYPHGDSLLIDKIVNEFLSQGKFDKLRKECMSDADTKPAYQNLQQRVENTVTQFLRKQVWRPDLNKNQLRDSLRKHILESKFFDAGINRIVDQVVNPNLLATVFLPEVEEVVYNYLSIPKPSDRNQKKAPLDDRYISSGREYDFKTSQTYEKSEKYGSDRSEYWGDHRKENHYGEEDSKLRDSSNKKLNKDNEFSNESFKTEPDDKTTTTEEKIKSDLEEQTMDTHSQIEKMEIPSDESQESLNRMTAEGLNIHETESAPMPDSDDSYPLEINEKSMSESRDSEDSIMNQMSPISQGRLTPDLEGEDFSVTKTEDVEVKKEEEKKDVNDKKEEGKKEVDDKKREVKKEEKEKKEEEKKPLTFIGRIPKIKRDDSKTKEEKREKVLYSSDESDSSKRDGSKKHKNSDRSRDRKRDRSKDRHKDRSRDRDRERHKKSSSSSSSSQRERSSSHHKSSHRHRDSKSRRREEEKKKTKSTDDHGKEKIKKDDRRSTDRDSNERERDRSSVARSQGESRKREKEQQKTEESKGENSQKEEEKDATEETPKMSHEDRRDSLNYGELFGKGILRKFEFPKITDDFYVKFNSTGFRYFEEWEKTKLDCEEEFKEFVDEAEVNLSLLSDDDSDFEFSEENRKTIADLLKGVGNFPQSIMFDPMTSLFYSWKDKEVFERIRKEGGRRRERRRSEESMKENIDRALHLKLLRKYRRRAMGVGRRRGRGRGIKEQNGLRLAALPSCNLVGRESSSVPEGVGVNLFVGAVEAVTLPDSPEETEDWSEERNRSAGRGGEKEKGKTDLQKTLPLNLPPSPDSDDLNNGLTPKDLTLFRKRTNKEPDEMGTPKKQKQSRRNYSQKYDSQDLYKPRPILNTSRTRGKGRERGLENSALRIGSPISR